MPYIGYFQLIKAVDKFIIYDDVNFIKGGWINRNNILLNKQRFLINILLSGASSNKLINEIQIQESQNKLIKTIESAYKKAPMFGEIFPLFLQIMEYKDKNLASFLGNSITELCKFIGIKTEMIYSSHIEKDNSLKAQEKILHICKLLEAKEYINAIGGQELYDKDDFHNVGIKLSFIKSNLHPYNQFNNEFIPSLSIMDVMMFNSVEEINVMLDKFEVL